MSKLFLQKEFEKIQKSKYTWSLYFFKIDRRNKKNPFTVYKVRFKNDKYLPDYATSLISTTYKYQINLISEVQNYDGENTKVSCDKISIKNELISSQWEAFYNAVTVSSDEGINGKINGYILVGQPARKDDDKLLPITFVKIANPIIQLANKKTVVYKNTVDNELDLLSDDICRLYLTIDFLVINQNMYTFNHSFEGLYNIEKTLKKIKTIAVDKIIETNSIANVEEFKQYSSQYPSQRTFITIKDDRVSRILKIENREVISKMLNIDLDTKGQFVLKNYDDASRLIKYLCYKIFQDAETNDILEATTISKISIAV
ncbi:MAG: DUF4868 domain-containing protein [Sedimentibacter sp.]|uniref:Kiwa anti-phage protein KwaB-like domain-containing protein n=1 Tax=Sedimentibacter sp. TaxID=1960295 RepID=UPI0029823834|nr:Kiwa anti-phage protein KwaB-like domain-containing protein [Sedimentibacter sp.]MDW5300719.1 DUF4868 domain-containing protein [Sedimentibacter sp.]